jgi:hypothetical protein
LELPTPCKLLDEETARNLIVGYAGQSCSPAERVDFEVHLIACDECLTTLAIIEDLLRFPAGDEEEEKMLAHLAAGSEGARIAWNASMKEASTSDSGDDLRKAA